MTIKKVIMLAILVLVGLAMLFCGLLLPTPDTERQQIVLQFERRVQTGPSTTLEFFTTKTPIAFGLFPLDPSAPEAPGTFAICELRTLPLATRTLDGKDAGQLVEVLFVCGGKRYVFQSLATVTK